VHAAVAAESAAGTLFRPAAQALAPAVAGTGRVLSGLNALSSFGDGVARLVGPPAGALLMAAAGFGSLVVVDAAAYVVAAALVAAIGDPRPEGVRVPRPRRRGIRCGVASALAEVAQGWAELRSRTVGGLFAVWVVFLAANASLTALLAPLGRDRLGGVEELGLALSGLGAGYLAGAVLARPLVDRVPVRWLLAGAVAGTGAGFAALFAATSTITAVPAAMVIGLFGSTVLLVQQTTMQRHVGDAVLGRVASVFVLGEAAASLAGAIGGAAVAGLGGLTTAGVVATTITLAAAVGAAVVLPTVPARAGVVVGGEPAA
jgi:hypothetical protein